MLLSSCTGRESVTGKCNGIQVDQSILAGNIEELLRVKPENKPRRVFRLQIPAFQWRN